MAAALRLATLKREGESSVARRKDMMEEFKLATLKREGRAAIAKRTEMDWALKLATLKREGAAAIERRKEATVQDTRKLDMLKLKLEMEELKLDKMLAQAEP